MEIPYSAKKDDLYYPGKNAVFFTAGRPQSDAALCVEIARLTYCQLEDNFRFDRDRVWADLQRIGFTDCKFFETDTHANGGGSHGLLAIDANARLAVLAFRGTDGDDPTDLMDDGEAILDNWQGSGKVSIGFSRALMEIWPQIEAALPLVDGYKVLFTGHSLGAAMATLASGLVKPDSLYTFGSPRVGDQTFVDSLKGLDNHRYVDCCDLVARVPPDGLLGHVHIPGNIYYINSYRVVRFIDPNDAHIGNDQVHAEAGYLLAYAWRTGDVAVRALADHTPLNYVWPVTAATP